MNKLHGNYPGIIKPALGLIRERLKDRPDSEHEQAAVRIFFPIALLIYLFFHMPEEIALDPTWTRGFLFSSAFLVFSIGLFIAIIVRPGVSVARRIIGLSADIGVFTFGLIATGELGAPWYAVYLWVTFGNGFRFGEKYLYLSGLLSILGFSAVLVVTPYWQQNMGLGFGLLASLIVLPGYAAFLIHRINVERERAEAASRAKSEFLARMSHEMRTPLNGVIVTGELLKSCPLGKEEQEYVETICTSGNALLNLIEDILDISKIEEGKLQIERTDFDLHALINATIRILTPQASEKGLHLTSNIALDTPYRLIGDPLHLRQILINLIGNAIKFTQQGRVELSCGSIRSTAGRSLIRFEVMDTGIGISEEKQQQIFEKFTQADESTTRRFGGTGLGTTISKQLVELMNGRIGVRSTPNIGSTFWFDIEFELQPDAVDDEEILKIQECRVLRLSYDAAAQSAVANFMGGWSVPFIDATRAQEAVNRLIEAASSGAPFELMIIDRLDDAGIHAALDSIERELEIPWLGVLVISRPGQTLHLAEHYRNTVYALPDPIDQGFLFNALHAFHGNHATGKDIINLFDRVAAPHLAKQKMRILVADDNAINRMLIGRILERAGHRHVPVTNGREALEALEASNFDVVILDMRMPDIGGLEAFKMFRFAHPDDKTPFVIVTADATTNTRQACTEAGIEHFLTKPISAEKLVLTVDGLRRPAVPLPEEPSAPAQATADEPTDREAVDRQLLSDIVSLAPDEAFLSNLLDNFLGDSRQLLEGMAEAIDRGDGKSFAEAAHALKGSAANIALPKLSQLALRAEQAAGHALSIEGPDCLEALREELERSSEGLREEIVRARAAG